MPDQKTCFIVGPIGEAGSDARRVADWLLKGVIRPVLTSGEHDFKVKRADEDAAPGSVTTALINDLVDADLVIADLTGFNPNAFYELGIRHALRKPAIHIIAEKVTLPFDNKDQRTIFVNIGNYDSVEDAKRRLTEAVTATQAESYEVTNPVTQAGAILALKESGDPKDKIIATLEERLSRMEKIMTDSSTMDNLIFPSSNFAIDHFTPKKSALSFYLNRGRLQAAASRANSNLMNLFLLGRLSEMTDREVETIFNDLSNGRVEADPSDEVMKSLYKRMDAIRDKPQRTDDDGPVS